MTARNSYAAVPTDALEPAAYNPNQLTDEQFKQLVAEVRHQRRVLKPIVVHKDRNSRHVIVDGEHNWRAAREAGLVEVPIEEIGDDEYLNAAAVRRQTFLRNKRGSYHNVKLGRMLVEAQFCAPTYPTIEERASKLARIIHRAVGGSSCDSS
jgi:ParB-like chromosome segregation protein Spo0J